MRLCSFVLITAAATTLVAAELPHAGKWKANPAKSQLTGTAITFESLPSGEWQSSFEGITYKFKMDGKDYPTGMGDTAAWKAVDSSSWETVWKANGKTISTETLKLAPDGKTLTLTTKGTKPNGEPIDNSAVLTRVSGGPGLAGKWKSTKITTNSPSTIEFTSSAADAVTFKEPSWGITCDSKLDGKDYPCSGPTLGPGWTAAMSKAGARRLEMTIKKDNKPLFKSSFVVAADGKSMTEFSDAIATGEKTKSVYDRQ